MFLSKFIAQFPRYLTDRDFCYLFRHRDLEFDLTVSCPCPADNLQDMHQNWFIHFQDIVFTSLVSNGRTDIRKYESMVRKHYASCQSSPADSTAASYKAAYYWRYCCRFLWHRDEGGCAVGRILSAASGSLRSTAAFAASDTRKRPLWLVPSPHCWWTIVHATASAPLRFTPIIQWIRAQPPDFRASSMTSNAVSMCCIHHPPHQTLHTGKLCHHRTQLKCCSIYSENKHIFITALKQYFFSHINCAINYFNHGFNAHSDYCVCEWRP